MQGKILSHTAENSKQIKSISLNKLKKIPTEFQNATKQSVMILIYKSYSEMSAFSYHPKGIRYLIQQLTF